MHSQFAKQRKVLFTLASPKELEEKHGKYLRIADIDFAYGRQAILTALSQPEGQAISYRFKKDAKSWKVFVSTALQKTEFHTQERIGAIGIDLNADHIACAETDRFGNFIKTKVFSWVSYGKTKGQLKAITGDLCKEIVNWAKITKKPISIEKLDFQQKKLALKDERNRKFSRLLSHFAYQLFFLSLTTRAFKEGVEVHQVNPAYTSIIGRINFAKRYGLSIHLAAAFCIARRHQKFFRSTMHSRWENSRWKRKPCRFCSTREESNKTRMELLGAGEEEIENGACSTLSGNQTILESAKPDSCDSKQLLMVTGEIPVRESLAKLLG